jgi:hypothetical protein
MIFLSLNNFLESITNQTKPLCTDRYPSRCHWLMGPVDTSATTLALAGQIGWPYRGSPPVRWGSTVVALRGSCGQASGLARARIRWRTSQRQRPHWNVIETSSSDMCCGGGLRRATKSSYTLLEDARLGSKDA